MFKAIGFVIVLFAIAHMMSEPFHAFENAVTETFNTVTVAAKLSQQELVRLDH